ncbi:MAG: glucose 1-dehydrogenase [Parvularculaceae bacterium]
MTDRLKGKTAIVTGGASGIGKATCRLFAAEGAHVIVADLQEDKAKSIAKECRGEAWRLDVAKEDAWEALVRHCLETRGKLDILVNCAGIGRAGAFDALSAEDWNAMIAVNLTGVFFGCKHAVAAMRESGAKGSIVNISSIAGLVGGDDIAGYSATKGGVTMLTKSVALAAAKYGIRCNSVHPTYVDSEMLDDVAENFPSRQAMLDGMASLVPLGRVAKPIDIAQAILFLASDESAMITGAPLIVDGGQLAGLPSRHSG